MYYFSCMLDLKNNNIGFKQINKPMKTRCDVRLLEWRVIRQIILSGCINVLVIIFKNKKHNVEWNYNDNCSIIIVDNNTLRSRSIYKGFTMVKQVSNALELRSTNAVPFEHDAKLPDGPLRNFNKFRLPWIIQAKWHGSSTQLNRSIKWL